MMRFLHPTQVQMTYLDTADEAGAAARPSPSKSAGISRTMAFRGEPADSGRELRAPVSYRRKAAKI
jgi:hypothetical protein